MVTPDKPEGVPNDEWLLAIGLANLAEQYASSPEARVATAIAPGGLWAEWSPAWNGASTILLRPGLAQDDDEGNPDYFAAGAALALALEDEP